MPTKTQLPALILTKLHRPDVVPDLVCRPRLHELLDGALETPLALISAPAGYGKSSLASHWLESREEPWAWLSLDETDGALTGFLGYFLAAVRQIQPDALPQLEGLLAGGAPSAPLVAGVLANELDAITTPFIVVLDDYHLLDSSSEVHELLAHLLHRPPRPLHLVVASRSDPPLPLAKLRANKRLTEVRLEDLRFTQAEASAFFQASGGSVVTRKALDNLHRQFEGWAAGLRLVSLTLRNREDPDGFLQELHGGLGAVQEYLVREVVDAQPEGKREWLLKTSILDRFCPELCETVCGSPGSSDTPTHDGRAFIESLRGENLFCLPLDSNGHWHRYHHQFQTLLQTQLAQQFSADEIANLHSRASAWLAEGGRIEEAVRHALSAGDLGGAAELVERQRMAVLDEDRWYLLEKWLSLLPASAKARRPALLLARAWILINRQALADVTSLLDEVEGHLGTDPGREALSGELAYFRGHFALFSGDGPRALELLEEARRKVPAELFHVYGEIEFSLTLARQMTGRGEAARGALENLLGEFDSLHPVRQTRIVAALVSFYLIADELNSADSVNGLLHRIAQETESSYALGFHFYMQGAIHLHRWELPAAESSFHRAVERRHSLHRQAAADAMVGLSLTQEALGRSSDADETRELLREYSRLYSDAGSLRLAESCRQRLSILRGEPPAGAARSPREHPTGAMLFWLEVPALTHCRALLAEGSEASLEEASHRLRQYLALNEDQHNTRQQVEILPLLARVLDEQGRKEEALASLERAVRLAAPGGSVRPFVEPGREMAALLRRLPPEVAEQSVVRRSLEATSGAGAAGPSTPVVRVKSALSGAGVLAAGDELTDRELEILELLEQRFQNKEIAGRLFISTHTVNDHLKHIYQKLQVHGRRQAVSRALELGLLGAR